MGESAEKTSCQHGKTKFNLYLAHNLHKINSRWLKVLTLESKTLKYIKRQYQKQCLWHQHWERLLK